MAKLVCCVVGANHSENLFEVWFGSKEPEYFCGYHFYSRKVVK
jgi:hypothetical protein